MGGVRILLACLLLAGCRTAAPDGPRLAALLGTETELDVSPWCLALLDEHPPARELAAQGGGRLYRLSVRCSPGYDFAGTHPLAGDLCETDGPPYVLPVLDALCNTDSPVAREAAVLLTLDQWNALVAALADRGLAGGER